MTRPALIGSRRLLDALAGARLGSRGALTEPLAKLPAEEARQGLAISPGCPLVLGWVGRADLRSGLLDIFEAIAGSGADYVLVIETPEQRQQELVDHADALEILDRMRFLAARTYSSPLDRPAVLGAVDAVVLAPPRGRADRIAAVTTVERAQKHAIPVIYHRHAELDGLVGPGGWAVPPDDPALMARLFDTLALEPELVAGAARLAADRAARRQEMQTAAADLARAKHAVAPRGASARLGTEPAAGRGGLQIAFKRQPSRT